MAKRRTKAQKMKALERRQEQVKTVVKKVTENLPTVSVDSLVSAIKPEELPSYTKGANSYRRRDLHLSLLVLIFLILLQLSLWLVFKFTTLDTHLYNLIKL